MDSTASPVPKKRRNRAAWIMGLVFVGLALVVWEGLCLSGSEIPFLPALWLARQTKGSDGRRVTDLIRLRSGTSDGEQHWHHCIDCDDIYTHVPHMAIRVTTNANLFDLYLF